MGFWAFQLLCLRKAAVNLRRFAHQHVVGVLVGIVIALPAVPLASVLGSTMSQELWAIAIQGLVGPAILIACVFTVFWIRAPHELWSEAASRSAEGQQSESDGPLPFRARRATYGVWDLIDPLELYQVACLWIDLAPPDSAEVELVGDASASLYALQRAVEQGELSPTYDHLSDLEKMSLKMANIANTGQPWPTDKKTRFTREALRSYAVEKGVRPKFLFPEARTNSWMAA